MEQKNTRLRNVGFITFFFSGICAISSGVVVSLLQEQYGFAYGMTGTLLSLMSIGNLLAGFLIAMLPGRLGMKPSILLLTIGYAVGYAMMGLSGAVAVLALGFLGCYIHFFKAYAWGEAFLLSGCVGVSLVVAMVISSLVGTVIPMLFHKIHIDPAVASGPLITTINDLVAVVVYYGLAAVVLIDMFHLG